MTDNVARYYIGDDWVIPLIVADSGGNPLNLSLYTLGATYYAPSGTIPESADVTSSIQIVTSIVGAVFCVVPNSITSMITAIPSGRKAPLAHVQLFTIDLITGYKITRHVVPIEPATPSAYDPRHDSADGPNYKRSSIFPFGEYL